MNPISIEDDGFVIVKIGDVENHLDLYEMYNRIVEIGRTMHGNPMIEQHQAIVDLLKSKGFADCSQRVADRFALAVLERVEELKKADAGGLKPSSPASMASTPSS